MKMTSMRIEASENVKESLAHLGQSFASKSNSSSRRMNFEPADRSLCRPEVQTKSLWPLSDPPHLLLSAELRNWIISPRKIFLWTCFIEV